MKSRAPLGETLSRARAVSDLRGGWRLRKDHLVRGAASVEGAVSGQLLPRLQEPKAPAVESVAIYARVSSADQKADLERQLGRLAEYASRERLMVIRSVFPLGVVLPE